MLFYLLRMSDAADLMLHTPRSDLPRLSFYQRVSQGKILTENASAVLRNRRMVASIFRARFSLQPR
jgi:hypothetical protein